jgi:hemoglobin
VYDHPAFRPYGEGDNSYRTAGERTGIGRLVDAFYDLLDTEPSASRIRSWHKPDLAPTRERLTLFLCGWLGGERLYHRKFGGISIPGFHRKFPIGAAESDAWLLCMEKAIALQSYPADFKEYLLEQLTVPAERSRSLD